jgi:hypothetical protein
MWLESECGAKIQEAVENSFSCWKEPRPGTLASNILGKVNYTRWRSAWAMQANSRRFLQIAFY